MLLCAACSSFVPPGFAACPNCKTELGAVSRAASRALAIAGGSLFAVTLSACYGMAYPEDRDASLYQPDASAATATCSDPALDLDGDGFCGDLDCDEANPDIHEGCD